MVGECPLPRGPKTKIPQCLIEGMALHVNMAQVSCGELEAREVVATIEAAKDGTEYESFDESHIWDHVHKEYPSCMKPSTMMNVEDQRANWTVYSKMKQWMDDAKGFFLEHGLVEDKKMVWRDTGETSQVTISEDMEVRFITFDETYHPLSTKRDNSGRREKIYINTSLSRNGHRGTRANRHVTGYYMTNLAGETLPPVFIFDTNSKESSTF